MKLLKGEYPVHAFVSPMDVGELLLPLYELYLRLLQVNDVTWKPNFCIIPWTFFLFTKNFCFVVLYILVYNRNLCFRCVFWWFHLLNIYQDFLCQIAFANTYMLLLENQLLRECLSSWTVLGDCGRFSLFFKKSFLL